jgi:hypothetical protein
MAVSIDRITPTDFTVRWSPGSRHNVLDMTPAHLKANDSHKNCEKACGVSCVIQTSLIAQKPKRYALRCARPVVLARLARPLHVVAQPRPLLQSPAP